MTELTNNKKILGIMEIISNEIIKVCTIILSLGVLLVSIITSKIYFNNYKEIKKRQKQ